MGAWEEDAGAIDPETGMVFAERAAWEVDRPVPAAREIPEEVETTVAFAIEKAGLRQYTSSPFLSRDRAKAAIEALRPHLAGLLVGALGGEEAVVERMARAQWELLRGHQPRLLPYDETDEDARRRQLELAETAWRSLMEDTPDAR